MSCGARYSIDSRDGSPHVVPCQVVLKQDAPLRLNRAEAHIASTYRFHVTLHPECRDLVLEVCGEM